MKKKEEQYDLMPHGEILKMRQDLAKMRQQVPTSAMSVSMEELADSIQEMNKMFKSAAEEMQQEDVTKDFKKVVKPIEEKLDEVIDQNHKIANAILTVVDLVNNFVDNAKHQQDEIRKIVQEGNNQPPAGPSLPPLQEMAPIELPKHDKKHKHEAPPLPPMPPQPPQQPMQELPPLPPQAPPQGMPPMPPPRQAPQMPPPGMPMPPKKKKRGLFEAFK